MHSVHKTPALVTAGAAAAVLLALGAAACSSGADGRQGSDGPGGPGVQAVPQVPKVLRSIGDGSTADTGPQPNQPDFHRLRPGEKPPQFVVFSWDGAVEDARRLLSFARGVGERDGAAMTYFLSGVTLLPADHKDLYAPPRHPRGTSDTGLTDRAVIADTLHELRLAWADGSEIGTYFNGHFCGQDGDAADQAAAAEGAGGTGAATADEAADSGPGVWTPEEWAGEIRQAQDFTQHWKTNTGLTALDPLPFDYPKAVVGGRAPCRTDPAGLPPAAKAAGFRYSADPSGQPQIWPSRTDGLWHFPLQDIPVPGRDVETLSSDDGFLTVQSGTPDNGAADRDEYAVWGRQMHDGLVAGFDRAYQGNRAPLVIRNHLESWNGGVYLKAVEDTVKEVCGRRDVRCVSFKQLADWLDLQDPVVLDRLRGLDVGQAPKGGWNAYLRGTTATPTVPTTPVAPASPVTPGAPAAPGPPSEAVRPGGR